MPQVPYYAVIFTSKRRAEEGDGYAQTAAQMDALARMQPGFLGVESVSSVLEGKDIFRIKRTSTLMLFATDADAEAGRAWQVRSGITVSYWKDEESIKSWKGNLDHLLAQKKGKNNWYLHYEVRISKVEREYTGGSS